MKKVLVFFAALTIVFWLIQIDDKINPEITTLIEYFSSPDESKAYLYLLGIDASEGEDPLIKVALFTCSYLRSYSLTSP